MNTQYCKIGKALPIFNNASDLKSLENDYLQLIEEAYNRSQLDVALSDYIYFEAAKLKQRILQIKLSIENVLDAA